MTLRNGLAAPGRSQRGPCGGRSRLSSPTTRLRRASRLLCHSPGRPAESCRSLLRPTTLVDQRRGWFRAVDGARREPLAVNDVASRSRRFPRDGAAEAGKDIRRWRQDVTDTTTLSPRSSCNTFRRARWRRRRWARAASRNTEQRHQATGDLRQRWSWRTGDARRTSIGGVPKSRRSARPLRRRFGCVVGSRTDARRASRPRERKHSPWSDTICDHGGFARRHWSGTAAAASETVDPSEVLS